MRTRLISIPTDTFPLDGVMYEPDSKVIGSVVMIFYRLELVGRLSVGLIKLLPNLLQIMRTPQRG
jgi:hypothetical protein